MNNSRDFIKLFVVFLFTLTLLSIQPGSEKHCLRLNKKQARRENKSFVLIANFSGDFIKRPGFRVWKLMRGNIKRNCLIVLENYAVLFQSVNQFAGNTNRK